MNNNRRNLKKQINEAMDKADRVEQGDSYVQEDRGQADHRSGKRKLNASMKWFGGISLAVGLAMLFFSGFTSVDTTETAANALKDKVSTAAHAGIILLEDDENIGQQDYTITHQSSEEETKIWIWDYAAEDGDFVQVLVNGTPTSEPFMIKHKPKEMLVSATGTVQVKGIKDGGGGITYAVRYDLNGTSYFNSAPEGEFNTYELVRE